MAITALFFGLRDAAADDGPFMMSFSGTPQPMNDVQIELRKQTTIITLTTNSYTVESTFEFFNHGATKRVLVGFPETADTRESNFFDFSTQVNAKSVTPKVTPWKLIGGTGGEYDPDNNYSRLWTKKVRFPAHTIITTRVAYGSKYSPDSSISGYSVFYDIATGRLWKDKIGKLAVIIRFNDDAFPFIWLRGRIFSGYHLVGELSEIAENISEDKTDAVPLKFRRTLNEMTWELTDFEPREGCMINIGLIARSIDEIDARLKPESDNKPVLEAYWPYWGSLFQVARTTSPEQYSAYEQAVKSGVEADYWLRKYIFWE